MPPKRKAGNTTAKKQAKAAEDNGDVEHVNDVKEKLSSEKIQEIDEEMPDKTESTQKRERTRRGVPTPVYTEEPPEKISKVDKKSKEKPEKKGKAGRKKEEVEEPDVETNENTGKGKQKSDRKAKADKLSEDKEKPVKENKKAKGKQEKEEKVKEKPGRKAKNKESEANGKDEGTQEKSEKSLLNPTGTKWDQIDFKCTKKNPKGETYNLKLSCWNVGGLKSWLKKDCLQFLDYEQPDIFCLQETRCSEEKLPDEFKDITDYKQYWCSSDKEGYAGVGLLSKKEPINVTYGINAADQDSEGRCITAEYDNYYVVCVYVPNAGRKLVTLPKRLEWNEAFKSFIKKLDKKKPVIICGDMNVSHNEIDLARPKSNTKNAGFTQEERDGMTDFLGEGYVDTFRDLYPEKADMYTFWSYMSSARSKNIGWRLDYFILSERIKKNVCDNVIRSEVYGSDHCPITLFINL